MVTVEERVEQRHQPILHRPVALDLFSGVGGLSLGFEQAGFDIATSVEYDPVHAAVHAFNFPLTRVLCANVATISTEALREAIREGMVRHSRSGWDGQVDVVFGGPPCQGFSTMGKRLVDDPRNQLVFHFFRIVRDIRPRYFVMENVPGMRAGGHSSILTKLVEEFEQIGYHVVQPVRILNAADYGVPQDRRRLILIGAREGEPLPNYPQPTVRPVVKHGEPRKPMTGELQLQDLPIGPSVADAISDLPDLDRFDELWSSDAVYLPDDVFAQMTQRASRYARRLRGLEDDPADYSYPRWWDKRLLTSSMRTSHIPRSVERFSSTLPGEVEPISRFYRLHNKGLSNTLRAGTGSERGAFTSPRPIHPTLPRVISVREAARLHSFPDWFRFHATKWHGMRQIGNAVPPLLGRAIAGVVIEAMGVRPTKVHEPIQMGDLSSLTLDMSGATMYFGVDKADVPQPRVRLFREA
jgi:DNA (cytosine-5)-methyltransferase 1